MKEKKLEKKESCGLMLRDKDKNEIRI